MSRSLFIALSCFALLSACTSNGDSASNPATTTPQNENIPTPQPPDSSISKHRSPPAYSKFEENIESSKKISKGDEILPNPLGKSSTAYVEYLTSSNSATVFHSDKGRMNMQFSEIVKTTSCLADLCAGHLGLNEDNILIDIADVFENGMVRVSSIPLSSGIKRFNPWQKSEDVVMGVRCTNEFRTGDLVSYSKEGKESIGAIWLTFKNGKAAILQENEDTRRADIVEVKDLTTIEKNTAENFCEDDGWLLDSGSYGRTYGSKSIVTHTNACEFDIQVLRSTSTELILRGENGRTQKYACENGYCGEEIKINSPYSFSIATPYHICSYATNFMTDARSQK